MRRASAYSTPSPGRRRRRADARARRQRGGRLSKPSVSVEAPHLVVAPGRRDPSLRPAPAARRASAMRPSRRALRRALVPPARRVGAPQATCDSGTARRPSQARRNKLWGRRAALKRTSRPRATGAASRRPPRVETPAARRPRALQMKPVRDRQRQTHAIDATSCRSASSRWSGRWNTWARVVAVAVDR